ncbi:target of Nesh-SH3 isoform X3 [Gasterosteus aculeatus]
MMGMQQHPRRFQVLFLMIFITGIVLSGPSTPRRSRVRRQNMKVRINATGDTIVMKFLHPNAGTKLEGYILGYGSSMFSKQFIQLPENGQPYETEFDAEPKYLIAVQPIPNNEVKKHCTGKVELQKPLHLVIGSVTPTSVLLSWGTLLKTPYEGNIMNDCLEDGHYTVRYRERSRKWHYQTCPTSDTVIDNLRPNAVYEFGVQPTSKDGTGVWSKPVIHNISSGGTEEKNIKKIFKRPVNPVKPLTPGPHSFPFSPHHVPHNRTHGGQLVLRNIAPKTTVAPTTTTAQESLLTSGSARPAANKQTIGTGVHRPSVPEVPRSPISSSVRLSGRNSTGSRAKAPPHSTRNNGRPFSPPKIFTSPHSSHTPEADGARHKSNALPKPVVWSKDKPVPAVQRPSIPVNKRPNLVGKPSDHDKPMDLKQGNKESILKTFPPVTDKPKQERRQQQTTTSAPAVNTSRFDINENSSIFRPMPASDVDFMGKKRFVAPHVIYKTDKKPDEPCSITSSLAFFPDEEGGDQNVTGPPRIPPSNLTVVTVEGCPSFVILDWQKSDNDTREYEVVSTTKGPNGDEVSVLTTNQTHTAVENLKPESSYEFTVTPKNDMGVGPSSDPVSFSTESADPRVSEHVSGKDAIWTQFPFKSDDYSECNGKQYVKRTWYRKFVGIQLCNSLRYKIYLSDSLNGKFYNIGDQSGHGEDHCQFVDSFLDGRTGTQLLADQLQSRPGFYRALRQEPVYFGEIGGKSHVTYVGWYECGTPIPGKW